MVGAAPLRGTEVALRRPGSAWRGVARALLTPPYLLVRATTWPVREGAVLYDESDRVRTVVDVFSRGVRWGRYEVAAFANYQTNEPFAELGLEGTRHAFAGDAGRLRLKAGWLDERRNVLDLGGHTPFENTWAASFTLLRDDKPERDFHGIGPRSPERGAVSDRRRVLLEGTLHARAGASWHAEFTTYLRALRLRDSEDLDGDDDPPPVSSTFPEEWAIARRSEYRGAELVLALDTRDAGGHSTHGVLLRSVGGVDRARLEGDAHYLHYAAEAQGFVDLFAGTRVLALRAYAGAVLPDGEGRLPFTELEHVGGRFGPRAFERDRFVDARQLVLTAEYRYRATEMVRGRLFVDWGTVSDRWQSLRLPATDPSFGVGVDVGRRRRASLQAAFGPEGVQLSFGTDTLFDPRSRRRQ